MRGFRRKCGVNYLTATVGKWVPTPSVYPDGSPAPSCSETYQFGQMPGHWPRVKPILLGGKQ